MAKRKQANQKASVPEVRAVLHGDCFHTFVAEATSLGNEVVARRQYDEDVVEYLQSKGLFDDWSAWRAAKRTPKT
jgi:hypothetical protein